MPPERSENGDSLAIRDENLSWGKTRSRMHKIRRTSAPNPGALARSTSGTSTSAARASAPGRGTSTERASTARASTARASTARASTARASAPAMTATATRSTSNPAVASPAPPARNPSKEVVWYSDDTFELRRGRWPLVYTFVTITLSDTPENKIRLARLLMLYSRQVKAMEKKAKRVPEEIAAARNVVNHLQVLYDLRGQPQRFLSRLNGILEPEETRTFLFKQIGENWSEVNRRGVGDVVEQALRSKGV